MINCPYCFEEIIEGALKCPHCHSLLRDFKICPRCCEQILINASTCKHCSFDIAAFERQQRIEAGIELEAECLIQAVASPFGAFFSEGAVTALLYPPEVKITNREVLIKKWYLFGLRTTNLNLSLYKIASVRFNKGVIWGGIIFESYGGGIPDLVINGLDKQEALNIVQYLDSLLSRISLERK